MPIRVERVADAPIVTITFNGRLTPDSVQAANSQTAALLQEMGTFYAIIDIRDTEMTIGEARALLESTQQPGVISSPRVHVVFLGEPVPFDPTQQNYPVFQSQEDALGYIRQRITASGMF